jgi:RNAse (barnase) inhibitor barstar
MVPFLFQSDVRNLITKDDLAVRIGSEVSSREELFERLAEGLKFPKYFGENWDALDDLLRDLHWVQAKRVVICHDDLPRLADEALRTYLKILRRAVEDWRRDNEHEVIVVFPENAELHVRELLNEVNPRQQTS